MPEPPTLEIRNVKTTGPISNTPVSKFATIRIPVSRAIVKQPLPVPGTYSVAQASARLGIGTSTVSDRLARCELPVAVARIGRTYKIKRAVLEGGAGDGPAKLLGPL
jgi:hypothetical protein